MNCPHGAQPLNRYGTADLARPIAAHPAASPTSASTIRRSLDTAARKPWQHQHRRYPAIRAPPRRPTACWTCTPAAEKTSIQARACRHPPTPPRPGRAMRVGHEYARGGALAYLAAWDMRRGGVIGRCEATAGIAPFGSLVAQMMQQEPYRPAPRVFWAVDNGSSHRGEAAAARLRGSTRTFSSSTCRPTPPGSISALQQWRW